MRISEIKKRSEIKHLRRDFPRMLQLELAKLESIRHDTGCHAAKPQSIGRQASEGRQCRCHRYTVCTASSLFLRKNTVVLLSIRQVLFIFLGLRFIQFQLLHERKGCIRIYALIGSKRKPGHILYSFGEAASSPFSCDGSSRYPTRRPNSCNLAVPLHTLPTSRFGIPGASNISQDRPWHHGTSLSFWKRDHVLHFEQPKRRVTRSSLPATASDFLLLDLIHLINPNGHNSSSAFLYRCLHSPTLRFLTRPQRCTFLRTPPLFPRRLRPRPRSFGA